MSLSERETAKLPCPPNIQHPTGSPGGLCVSTASSSAQLIMLEHYEAGGSGCLYQLVPMASAAVARFPLVAAPSHWIRTGSLQWGAASSSLEVWPRNSPARCSMSHTGDEWGQPFTDQVSQAQGITCAQHSCPGVSAQRHAQHFHFHFHFCVQTTAVLIGFVRLCS